MTEHHSKATPGGHRGRRPTLRSMAALAASSLVLALTPLAGAQDGPRPRDVVYVEGNDPAGNVILAYRRDADGRLVPLPGSPFPTGGRGMTPTFDLGPFDSDQSLIADPSRSTLFAVNGGSDDIAVLKIRPDGSLRPVAGSPFPSGGTNPVSVGLADGVLCVVNKDMDPGRPGGLPNYASFRVEARGRLTPAGPPLFVGAGSSPTQALTDPEDRLVFGADFMGGLVRSFAIGRTGRLWPVDARPLPASEFVGTSAPRFPLGLTRHPRRRLLYVGLVTINRLGVYRYTEEGRLIFLRSVPNSGKAICWLIVNKAGTRLYSTNTADPSVSVYDLSGDPARPVELQTVPLRTRGGAFQLALDPREDFLHVVTQQDLAGKGVEANALSVLRVGPDGLLTEVPSSPTPLPVRDLTRPQGVVAL